MKKALSVILSVLVIFSMFGMVAAAAPEGYVNTGLVTIEFQVDGVVYKTIKTEPELNFVNRVVAGGDAELGIPEKASTETTRYIFECWRNKANDHETQTGNIPAVQKDNEGYYPQKVVYEAVFAEEDIIENQTFWAFVQSIFARINMIFEYFAKVFEGVFTF